MMCWILPGTSMDLNFAGRSGALWGMCKSPRAKTSTILNNQNLKVDLGNLQRQSTYCKRGTLTYSQNKSSDTMYNIEYKAPCVVTITTTSSNLPSINNSNWFFFFYHFITTTQIPTHTNKLSYV